MAKQTFALTGSQPLLHRLAAPLAVAKPELKIRPDIGRLFPIDPSRLPPQPVAPPQPPPELPEPMAESSFDKLPYPDPGDPIRSEDFKTLSQSLQFVRDAYRLAGALFGMEFGAARTALQSQGYSVRAISVYGQQPAGSDDATFDGRLVLSVNPADPGTKQVLVVLSEAATTRRVVPNLIGLTPQQARETLREALCGVPHVPQSAPNLVGRTIADLRSL